MPSYAEANLQNNHGVNATKYGASISEGDLEFPDLPPYLPPRDTGAAGSSGPSEMPRSRTDANPTDARKAWKKEAKDMLMQRLLGGPSVTSSAPPTAFFRGSGCPGKNSAPMMDFISEGEMSNQLPSQPRMDQGEMPNRFPSRPRMDEVNADDLLDGGDLVFENFEMLPDLQNDVGSSGLLDSDDSSAQHAASTRPVVRGDFTT